MSECAARARARALARRLCALAVFAVASPRLSAQELVTARFEAASAAAVDSVRRLGVDVVEARPRPDGRVEILAVVSSRDRALLASRGYFAREVPRAPALAVLESRRAALGAAAFTVFRDFDDPARGVKAYLRALAASRTNLTVDSIGASTEGRPILAVKIGAPDDSPTRPNVLFLSTYHAREWAATEVALRLIQWLADSLPLAPGGATLLASRDVWVIPVANPDGYQYAFTTTRLWRKNRRANGDRTFGVDLNRNHAAFFALDDLGSSADPSAETYRGPAAESEPEIRAIVAFHRAHPPAVAITYHSYVGAVLYPWGQASGALAGDDPIFRALAGTDLAPAVLDSLPGSTNSSYHPGPGWHLYPTNGDYADWAYRAFGTAAFTVELTSGCCVAGGGYYGFEFPDDDALLARVALDNRPFALALLRSAADLSQASGPPGAPAPGPGFESVWPEVRVIVPAGEGGGGGTGGASGVALEAAADSGVVRSTTALPDTLGSGSHFARYEASGPAVSDLRALRVAQAGLVAEILARDGAERSDSPWHGFARSPTAFEGSQAWLGRNPGDTLVSPAIPVAKRSGLTLFFWTQHGGTLFDQTRRGLVEISTDGGATWMTVHEVLGAAPEWYPVAVPLPSASAATTLRVRFIAAGFPWLVDAVAVAAGETRLFDVAGRQQAGVVEVSANPVHGPPVTLRWPAGTGAARVQLFTLLGTPVRDERLSPDPGRWVWDLATTSGAAVMNGLYYVVVTRDDGTRYRRRLFVARTVP